MLLTISILLIMGAICSNMAKTRNRDEVLGFAAGFAFGIFAVLYYYLAGEKA